MLTDYYFSTQTAHKLHSVGLYVQQQFQLKLIPPHTSSSQPRNCSHSAEFWIVNQTHRPNLLQGNPARSSGAGHWEKAKQLCLQQFPAPIHTSPQTCGTTMARQEVFMPVPLPRKCTWVKWDQSSLLRLFFFLISNRSDLMIKIKTYVYTYGGLFSSKLKLINSRMPLLS